MSAAISDDAKENIVENASNEYKIGLLAAAAFALWAADAYKNDPSVLELFVNDILSASERVDSSMGEAEKAMIDLCDLGFDQFVSIIVSARSTLDFKAGVRLGAREILAEMDALPASATMHADVHQLNTK